MGYLEDFVQKIYLSQKEQPAYQNPPQHSPYSSMNQGFGLNASPYNPTYSHQQNQSNLRETYSQNLPHSQSVNFQPYGMRQSYQSNPYSLHDEYNFTSPGQTGKHQQSYKEGLPEFNSIRFETEKRDTHNSSTILYFVTLKLLKSKEGHQIQDNKKQVIQNNEGIICLSMMEMV